MMTSKHDLSSAIKKYKFALLPKVRCTFELRIKPENIFNCSMSDFKQVFSELDVLVPVLLMAFDEVSYRQWTQRFTKIIR